MGKLAGILEGSVTAYLGRDSYTSSASQSFLNYKPWRCLGVVTFPASHINSQDSVQLIHLACL